MPKTLELCRLSLRIGLTLAQSLPIEQLCVFFSASVDAFVRIAGVFPPLATMTIELLDTLRKLAKYSEGLVSI